MSNACIWFLIVDDDGARVISSEGGKSEMPSPVAAWTPANGLREFSSDADFDASVRERDEGVISHVAEVLRLGAECGDFDGLVLIAPEHFSRMLHAALPYSVTSRMLGEIVPKENFRATRNSETIPYGTVIH